MLIHTGQHYAEDLTDIFFRDLDLPVPQRLLNIGGSTRGQQIGAAVQALDEIFGKELPGAVVAQGDTNTVLAATIAASARSVPLVHVEAGLRSYDRAMREEHNRVATDHLSDVLLAPTDTAFNNLRSEGIAASR